MNAPTTDVALRIREALVGDYLNLHLHEAVRHLETLRVDAIAAFVQNSAPEAAARIVERLRPDLAANLLAALAPADAGTLAAAMDPGVAAPTLARLSSETRDPILRQMEPTAANELRELMTYPPDSAGGLMDPVVVVLKGASNVREALARVREVRHKPLYRVLIVDDEQHLIGAIPLQDLAVAEPRTELRELVRDPPPSIQTTASQAQVVEMLEELKVTSLPVVDFEGRVVGVIRQEGLLQATEEEATADIQTMVGASKDERALSPVRFAVAKRLPWLHVNLATAFLAAFVVGLFEGTIARFTALAVLLPVAAGQSGNTGAQALAVTMRGLALREIRVRQWIRVVSKEVAVGALNGVAIGIVTAAAVYFWSRSVGLAFVIGIAMVISMTIASIAGSSVPIVLTILRQDPAQASSIVLTTITDIAGFLSFLGLATLLADLL